MVGSADSFDFCPQLLDTEENAAIPLKCWQNICLSNIWIPSDLLSSRNKSSSRKEAQGIFHTLEKKDSQKCCESFSVYSDQCDSDKNELFESDSDDELLDLETTSFEKIEDITVGDYPVIDDIIVSSTEFHNSEKVNLEKLDNRNIENHIMKKGNYEKYTDKSNINIEYNESIPKIENFSDSHSYLNEIVDTSQINVDFSNNCERKYDTKVSIRNEMQTGLNIEQNNKKEERKMKRKTSKYISLDQFLDDDVDTYKENYFEEFYQNLMLEKNGQKTFCDPVQIKSKVEFPDLITNEYKFFKSDKLQMQAESDKQNDLSLKSAADVLHQSYDIKEEQNICNNDERVNNIKDKSKTGKIIIENIPLNTTDDDIYSLLFGYGEIKNFSITSSRNFLTACIEIDLICDIDWIIECLNGSEPFGASSEVLKCYKV